MTNKILVAVFVILLLFVAGEVGYFFFYRPQKSSPKVTSSTPTPLPTLSLLGNPAMNKGALKNLGAIKKGILTTSTLTNQYQGTISELQTQGGVVNQIAYKLMIGIAGEQGGYNRVYYTENDLSKAKFFTINQGRETPINADQLKIGDKIVIKETSDLTKDVNDNIIELNITKL